VKTDKIVSIIAVALALAEVLLVLVSWLLSATMTGGVRSLLSSEGVRWFFGQFTAVIATPYLVWLLLAAMAIGSLRQSGVADMVCWKRTPADSRQGYRHQVAVMTTLAALIIYIGVIVALTAVPHAVLLSATGQLMPSAFSRALVPIVAFGLLLLSAVYGLMAGRFTSVADVVRSMTTGIADAAPLLLLYMLAAQLYTSLRFVFSF